MPAADHRPPDLPAAPGVPDRRRGRRRGVRPRRRALSHGRAGRLRRQGDQLRHRSPAGSAHQHRRGTGQARRLVASRDHRHRAPRRPLVVGAHGAGRVPRREHRARRSSSTRCSSWPSSARGRPGNALVDVSSAAFPSGHTTTATTIATALAVIAWPTRWRWPVRRGRGRLLPGHGGLARVPRRALAHRRDRGPGARVHHRHGRARADAVAVSRGGRGGSGGRGRGRAGRRRARRTRRPPHCPSPLPSRRSPRHRRRLPGLGQHPHGRQRHARGADEGLGQGGGGGRRAGGAAAPARPLPPRRRDQRRRLPRVLRAARARARRPGRLHRRRRLLGRGRRPQAQLRVLPGGAAA